MALENLKSAFNDLSVNKAVRETARETARVQHNISIDNVVRKELKDIQMRIWGFRSIIGQAQTSIVGWNDQLAVIENPDYDSIING